MQRSALLRSSGPERRRCLAAAAACLRWASGVNAGILPSGGSTTSDVRLSNALSTIPTELLVEFGFLYRSRLAKAARKMLSPAAKSLAPSLKSRSARFCKSATSASVRNGLPSSTCGRSTGVARVFAQNPWRSGWPSGVRGEVHVFAAVVFLAVAPAWPATATGARATIVTTMARAPNDSRNRLLMQGDPPRCCSSDYRATDEICHYRADDRPDEGGLASERWVAQHRAPGRWSHGPV